MADWNERYRQQTSEDEPPHPLVVRIAEGLKPGNALDLACGAGRNALWLAQRGWNVSAVDKSWVAIDLLKQKAIEKTLTIDMFVADLEAERFEIQAEFFDLIVICNYWQPDLFAAVKNGVRPGGIVIAVAALAANDAARLPGRDVKPMNPAFLAKPGELREHFKSWKLLHDFEGQHSAGRRSSAEIVGRKAPL